MELIKTHTWFNQLEKKLFLFFVAFSSTQIVFLNSRFVFLVPLLSLAFTIGKIDVLFVLAGILSGAILIQEFSLILFAGVLVLLLTLLIPVYSLKTRSLTVITSLCMLFVDIFFMHQAVNTSIMRFFVSCFVTYLSLNNTSVFIHERTSLKESEIYYVGVLLFIILLPIYQLSPIFLMIWLRLLALLILYITSFKTCYELAVTMSFLLLIMDLSLKEEILLFLLPLSFFHLFHLPTKLGMVSIYLFSHLTLPFLTENHIRPYVLEVIFSSGCFMMLPSSLQLWCDKETKANQTEQQYASTKRKLTRQLENYSDLFYRIAHSFHDMKLNTSVISYVGQVEDELCENCINAKECFNKQKGDHRLIKLLKKGIIEGLNKEEQHYVECYCLHMAQYKRLMAQQHKLYQHQKEMNEEYQVLKHHLYDQLSLVGELLKHYADNVHWSDHHNEENMKELLEAYHYKIWFLHKEDLSLQTFSLEIGLTEITKKEVKEVIIPVLEKYLDTKLAILKIENNASQLGYTRLVLSNHHHYELIYAFQQISKDQACCGDSYLTFQHHSNTIVALSDGMGYGRRAHEESELTLDVFSRLLKSGIELDDCIQTINALLRIKNRIEMFTTLDLLMFDTNLGQARFIKNGATPSYIYRNGELLKIEPNALPIGIVNEVETYQESIPCFEDDYIILYSDGFDCGIEEVVLKSMKKYDGQPPQIIVDTVMNDMLASHQIDDDATMIILKVQKI